MYDKLFCNNLAKLFYAIASIDKVVKEEEVVFFKTNLEKQMKSFDYFKNDNVNMIFSEFNSLLNSKAEPNECFKDFKSYYKKNSNLFSQTLKDSIWKIADGIAASSAGKNKSEVILLAKLKQDLLG